jgi:hypothetical protein
MRTASFAILIAALAFGQAVPEPPPREGTIAVSGRVVTVTGNDQRPVRRAKVSLTGGSGAARVTATDTAGTFRFDPLPAGDYRVTVQKPGFVTLEAAASSESTMTLERAGAIEGTVVDGAGEPLINVSVYALQLQDGGEPRPVAIVRTDDLGRYRMHSLPAGDYYVEAAPHEAHQAFYPAASVLEDAKPVRVSLGRDTGSIDFTLKPAAAPAEDSAVALHGGPPGTARIVGQVVDAASTKPIRNASVRIVPVDGQRFGLLVRTDTQGRFAFSSLPAGRYSASAEAERFVSLEFGQKHFGEAGTPIQLGGGEEFRASFMLPRASALEGTVFDEFGDPAPNVIVRTARKQYVGGRHRLITLLSRRDPPPTDDQGHYRIQGLPPGEHYVVGLPRYAAGVSGTEADLNDAVGFAPTYYPGTADSGAATPLTITPGVDASAPFSLVPAKTVSVSGVIVDEAGEPVAGMLWLTTPDMLPRIDINLPRVALARDGTFLLRHVPPGSYTMQGFAVPPSRSDTPMPPTTFGWLPISVGDSDLTNVILQVRRGVALRGRVVLDDASTPPPGREHVRVTAIPVEFDSAPITEIIMAGAPVDFGRSAATSPPSETHADLSFEVKNLSGMRRILVSVASPGWALKKITRNGIDITDTPQDFRTKGIDDVEVVLSSEVSRVTGGVSDDDGPLADYAVVVFPNDPTKWIDRSRFVVMARPNQQGRFEVRGLPPEDYLVIALPGVIGLEWQDPDFLQQLRSQATSFTLSDGESKTLDLRLKKRP